jgi:hypothetical protein
MGAFESTASVVHLFARCEVRESCSPLSTRLRAPAGVPSLRMCRRRFEPPWAHSQGGHPREARDGEACISHQAGRRDGRRRPKAFEHEDRHTPPQGGEPERRRDQRRTRRQAGATEIRSHVPSDVAAERGPQQRAWRSQAPLKELRPASGCRATGGRRAPRHGPRSRESVRRINHEDRDLTALVVVERDIPHESADILLQSQRNIPSPLICLHLSNVFGRVVHEVGEPHGLGIRSDHHPTPFVPFCDTTSHPLKP